MSLFEQYDTEDVAALIRDYPLAWVLPADANAADASLLPLVGEYDAAGQLVSIIGHVPRANTLTAALRADSRATILFSGPNGYVSPEHAGRRDWGPTWNFAQVRVAARITLDAVLTDESLDVLIDALERNRAEPWTSAELGARYTGMAQAIIGFRATVLAVHGRFKLGQDERPETLQSILERHPDEALKSWMRRLSSGRC